MELHLGENPLSVVYMINSEAATAIVNTPLSLCLVYWANISCALLISASWGQSRSPGQLSVIKPFLIAFSRPRMTSSKKAINRRPGCGAFFGERDPPTKSRTLVSQGLGLSFLA